MVPEPIRRLRGMANNSDSEFRALEDQLDKASTAEIPNLLEIRRCKKQIIEHLAYCVMEMLEGDKVEPASRSTLRAISNDAPLSSTPRGICSPIKTEEIRRFEDLARDLFGNIESCTTAWMK